MEASRIQCTARDPPMQSYVCGGAHVPTPEGHRRPILRRSRGGRSDLWSHRTDEGLFDGAAAWAMMRVAPLGRRVRRDRRLGAWRRRRGGRRLRVKAALPSPEVAEAGEAAVMVAPRLPDGLVNTKAPLVNSPPEFIHSPNKLKKINNNLVH